MEQPIDNISRDDFINVTIKALGPSTLQIISKLLNPIKIIPTEEKFQRDWRGLAELINLDAEDISSIHTKSDPTQHILSKWTENKDSTVRNLIFFLQKLDRFDVIDDIKETMVNDLRKYNEISSKKTTKDTGTDIIIESDLLNSLRKQPRIHYNAFVLFANEDIDFAKRVITTMEETFKLNLFVKDRDLIGGVVQYTATMKVIANRCDRLIVILSPAFVRSAENKYFISFAQSIGIEQSRRKIIPCIYQPCTIPSELKPLYMLDYTRAGIFFDFFDKLYKSIISPLNYDRESLLVTCSSMESKLHNGTPVKCSSMESKLHNGTPVKCSSMETLEPKLQNGIPQVVSKSNQSLDKIPEYKKSKSKVKKFFSSLKKDNHSKNRLVKEKC